MIFFQDLVNMFTRVQNTMSRHKIEQIRFEGGRLENGEEGHQIPEFTRWDIKEKKTFTAKCVKVRIDYRHSSQKLD